MKFVRRLRFLFRRRDVEDEMAEEMQFHLEERAADYADDGASHEEARYAARRRFGNLASIQERARETHGWGWLERGLKDLRFAFRQLAKAPAFTATVLVTLGICLGANLTIFALVDAVIVRSLPLADPDRLVTAINSYPGSGVNRSAVSVVNYYEWRSSIPAFASTSIQQDTTAVVGGKGAPDRVPIARVSPEFFMTLGVPLAIGRSFTSDEMLYGRDEVAVLTDSYWRAHFGADPEVVGRKFLNDGLSVQIIGVLPKDFRFLSSRAQFYRPASHGPQDITPANRHNTRSYLLVARLAAGATLATANAQLDAFNGAQLATDPFSETTKKGGFHTFVRSLHDDHVHAVKPTVVLLQCGVLFLLLIGVVNLSNLILIRASGRAKELAVRQALGASRWHIVRYVLLETTLLMLGGSGLALLLARVGIDLLSKLGTDQLPLGATVTFDLRLVWMALAAAFLLVPALSAPILYFARGTTVGFRLQSEGRSGTITRTVQRLRHGFIAIQIALAFVLLSGAGLLSLSLKRLMEVPLGFQTDGLLTGQLVLPWKNYPNDRARLFLVERLLPVLRGLPGVTAAAMNSGLPFTAGAHDSTLTVERETAAPGVAQRSHYLAGVSGDYWSAMNIRLIEGRFLEDADNRRRPKVCVVDEAFARQYWPGASPLGRRLCYGMEFREESAITVVGVVGEVKQDELTEGDGHGAVYFPYAVYNVAAFSLVVRTSLPAAAMAPMIKQAILRLDPELPIDDLKPMRTRINDSLVARRSPAILAGVFAGVALLLTAIGTYGVLAYAVSQRRREIGVRMALGAQPQQVLRQFLRFGTTLFSVGLFIGVPLAWGTGRLMQSVIFSVGTFNLAVLGIASAAMAAVVFVAVLLPSQRAARVNPIEVLRLE